MNGFLRFSGAVKRDPAIDKWLRGVRDELRPLAEALFARMWQSGDDVLELMHDGARSHAWRMLRSDTSMLSRIT